MARTVADLALYLSVLAGPDARDPLSIDEDPAIFRKPLERDFKGVRIAWSVDFGSLPVDQRVRRVMEGQRKQFENLGCIVEDACPYFMHAHEAFTVLRALAFELHFGAVMDAHPGVLKDTIVWNIEAGRKLSAASIARAQKLRSALFERMQRFMETYEFLVLPVNQVPPFPIDQPYPAEIDGVKMDNYIDWMRSCYYVTAAAHPAVSVPCGFTEEGLPVGVQIVGRHRAEFELLRIAHGFERVTQAGIRRPAIAN